MVVEVKDSTVTVFVTIVVSVIDEVRVEEMVNVADNNCVVVVNVGTSTKPVCSVGMTTMIGRLMVTRCG